MDLMLTFVFYTLFWWCMKRVGVLERCASASRHKCCHAFDRPWLATVWSEWECWSIRPQTAAIPYIRDQCCVYVWSRTTYMNIIWCPSICIICKMWAISVSCSKWISQVPLSQRVFYSHWIGTVVNFCHTHIYPHDNAWVCRPLRYSWSIHRCYSCMYCFILHNNRCTHVCTCPIYNM